MSTDIATPVTEADPDLGPAMDPIMEQLHARLHSMDRNCLAALEHGLNAMLEGDFTFTAEPVTEPIACESSDAHLRSLVDLFNAMLVRSQATLAAYESLRVELAGALGDISCLAELRLRLRSLEEHCLTDLDVGLQSMVDGDLTRAARPATLPLTASPGHRLGELGETFNKMLARSRTALRSYDTMREDLRVALGDTSCLDELRASLYSLHRHCLRDLDEGLEAAASGVELTRAVEPVTKPIAGPDGRDLGELAEVFNRMLARAQSSLTHYDELRKAPRSNLLP